MSVKMTSFQEVFERYSALGKARDAVAGHKESQVRDKLMEIAEAVGIDLKLLRAGEKFNSPLEIPETSVDFLVEVLVWHTSQEAKALRKGDFLKVSAERKKWLINGFTLYLERRGYDDTTIEHQRQRMEHRMGCSLQKALDILRTRLMTIHSHVSGLRQSLASHFSYEDQVMFAEFADKKVAELMQDLDEIAFYLDEGRAEEIYELALDDLEHAGDVEIMERELRQEQVWQSISQDERYQKLEKKRDELVSQEGFVKKKQARYKQIIDEMQKIADDYEIKYFGDVMEDEPGIKFLLKHPSVALAEAIEYKKEVDEDRKRMMARQPISDEEKERMRQCFIEQFGEDPLLREKGEDEDA